MNVRAYAESFPADRKPLPLPAIKALVQVVDLLLVVLSALACFLLVPPSSGVDMRVSVIVVATVLAAVAFLIGGCYSDSVVFSKVPRVRPVAVAWLAVIGMLLFIDFSLSRTTQISRLWSISWAVLTLAMLAAERTALSVAISRLAHTGYISQRSVIVGAGPVGRRFAAGLKRMGEPQTKVIGFIDVSSAGDGAEPPPGDIEGFPVLGRMDDLVWLVREERIEQVFVALPSSSDRQLAEVLDRLSMLPVHVRLVPAMASVEFPNRPVSTVAGMLIIHVSDKPISGWSYCLKTIEDRAIAGLAMAVVLPAFLLIALAIKLDSPGPVFFRQPRRGFNNRLFEVYKFRTMYHNRADLDCEVQTTRNDPRVTRVGRFLRKTSLDELPQLLNVLKGDMSLVGPRPHAVSTKAQGRLFEEVVREYPSRYRVKPGITGWAQVNGWRGETDTEEKLRKRIEYDLFYIENWSIMLDIWIMIKTLLVVFKDDRAY